MVGMVYSPPFVCSVCSILNLSAPHYQKGADQEVTIKSWWDYHQPGWYLRWKLHNIKKEWENKPKLWWQVYAAIVLGLSIIIGYIRFFHFFIWLWHTYLIANPGMCCMMSSPVPQFLLAIEISLVAMLLITTYIDFMARGHIGHMRDVLYPDRKKTRRKKK